MQDPVVCPRCHEKTEEKAGRCAACGATLDLTSALHLAADPRRLIGRTINGKYKVLSILGEGGMGVVYKVRHLLLQNKNNFALKILHPKFSTLGDVQARFLREVEIAMELTHENIIQIRDFGVTEQNLLFYTMDFFPGESLKTILKRERTLPPARVCIIARQVLLALAEAHQARIVHRDLKPDNVLTERTEEGGDRVRVLDFGIAKILTEDVKPSTEDLTGEGAIGTPRYMSPEQISGEPIDGRCDLYSLGCMLYQMLTGKPPFAEGAPRSILLSHLTVPPRRFKELNPPIQVPPLLEDVVFRLLEKDRRARPSSAEDVLETLDGRRPAPPITGAPLRRRRVTGRLAVAAVAVAILGAVAWIAVPVSWREPGPRSAQAQGSHEEETDPGPPGSRQPADSSSRDAGKQLRCAVCGAAYLRGEKLGDMCHGEPLVGE